jgi:hypothetical protein
MENAISEESDIKKKETGPKDGNQHFYVLLKVLTRIELYVFALGVLFYFISASISWKFDVDGAQKLSSNVEAELNPFVNKPLTDSGLQKLEKKIDTVLKSYKLQPVSISNFIVQDTNNAALYRVISPTVTPDEISVLEGISSWSRYNIDTLVSSRFKNSSKGLDMFQFIEQGAFTSNFHIYLILFLVILLSMMFITQGVYFYHTIMLQRAIQQKQDELRKEVQEGTQASPVWELAQITLNKYYTRNLSQNNWIFYVSVIVMIAGFGLVLYGIAMAYNGPNNKLLTIVSAASGVIVQFIGATFLVIYNSTISQAIQYTASLQKVSTVGTSLKILDSIKNDETEEMQKNNDYVNLMITAKIDIAKLLIEQSKT